MSYGIYSFALVAIMAAASSKPHSGLSLSEALNRTLCPTVVQYDDDPERIPRFIKTLECERRPEEMCAAGAGAGAGAGGAARCCRLPRAGDLVFKCVQVIDNVLVSTRNLSRTYHIPVPVGCSCIEQRATPAQDAR